MFSNSVSLNKQRDRHTWFGCFLRRGRSNNLKYARRTKFLTLLLSKTIVISRFVSAMVINSSTKNVLDLPGRSNEL